MSLDLTRAELLDRIRKVRSSQNHQRIILTALFALMIAAAFGLVPVPTPIRGY